MDSYHTTQYMNWTSDRINVYTPVHEWHALDIGL